VATRVKKDTVGVSDEVKRGFLNSKDFSVARTSSAAVPPSSTVGSLVETTSPATVTSSSTVDPVVETTDDCPTPTTTVQPSGSIALNSELTAFGSGFFGLDTFTLTAQNEQKFTFFLREEVDNIKFRIKPLDDDSSYTYTVTDPNGVVYGSFGTSKSTVQKFKPAPFNYWTIDVKAETDSIFAIGWKPPKKVDVVLTSDDA